MADETPLEIVEYYQGLLVMQYKNKPQASGTIAASVGPGIIPQTSVQTITFSLAPTSGTFVLSYNGNNSGTINWNDSAGTIQTTLQAVTGLGSVTVIGSIAGLLLTITFTGVIPPAYALVVVSSTLLATATSVAITITETDVTIPLAVENGFNLTGSNIAIGAQLDVLGMYVGVSRSGLGFTDNIMLDDTDFLTLIQMAIIKNSAGSSLATITEFIFQFFGTNILVHDYANMNMVYFISGTIVSSPLVQLFITEGLLPKPMAVGISVFYPVSKVFSFRTVAAASIGWPFNTTHSYTMNTPWLSAHNLLGS